MTDWKNKFLAFVKPHLFEAPDSVHFVDNGPIVGRHNLCAVIPVSFITVVLFWVMGGSDHNPAFASEMPDCE